MRNRILYYALKYNGEFKRISKAILNNEAYEKVVYKGKFLTIMDDDYPSLLLELKFKPWILFYEGDLSLLNKQSIGIVGSRDISSYGVSSCLELINELDDTYCVISGLARGIDACVHRMSIDSNRSTIAVVGCGLDIVYPKENRELYQEIKAKGLILSEYPYGVKPFAHHFPWRNRMIAALSKVVIVVEAKKRSGTMITVNEALELGRDVYCFPHNYFNENGVGCNHLILIGCNIIVDKKDINEL